ncbi:hypothetical protein AHAS_Ahas02G0069700 [Arachis hypogaea]
MSDVNIKDNFIPSSKTLDDVWDIENPIYQFQHCKAWMWSEKRLAKFKQSPQPKFSLCCMEEKIELSLLSVPLDELIHLHTRGDQRSIHFLKNIRAFNSMFYFTSMAGKINHGVSNGTAPPIFKHGLKTIIALVAYFLRIVCDQYLLSYISMTQKMRLIIRYAHFGNFYATSLTF